MPEYSVGVRRKRGTAPLVPNAPGQPTASATTQTSVTLTWTAATVPSGGTTVSSYRIIQDGFYVKIVQVGLSTTVTGLTAGATYSFRVRAVNSLGQGAASTARSVTTTAASGVPGAPGGFTLGTVTATTVVLSWSAETPDPSSATTGYNVYAEGSAAAVGSTAAGVRTVTLTGLSADTTYNLTVKAINAVGESAASSTVAATTSAGAAVSVIRSDRVVDASGINLKFSYGSGTVYGENATAFVNTDKLVEYATGYGARTHRERLVTSGSAQTRQRRGTLALSAVGCRFHATIGDLSDAYSMDEPAANTWAHDTVLAGLAELAGYYLTNAPVSGDLSSIIHSIAGPNEVETTSLTGPNWARNSQIIQEQIWKQARLGSVVPGYVSLFADVIIASCSTRSDLYAHTDKADLLGSNITGRGVMADWCDWGNAHRYQTGASPTTAMITEMRSATARVSGAGKPDIFSECGYNNMTFTLDGTYIGGNVLRPGNPNMKIPPWVSGIYTPRAVAVWSKNGSIYERFELLDDPDPATTFNQQSHYGAIAMQGDTVAACPPSGWLPKPEYYAMRRFNALLKDRTNVLVAPTFATAALSHTVSGVSGAGVNFSKLVTQKANGRWYMLIWRDVDVYNTDPTGPGNEITIASVTVSILFPQARTINVYQPNDATSASLGTSAATAPVISAQSGTVAAGGTFTVGLKGDLKILEIY